MIAIIDLGTASVETKDQNRNKQNPDALFVPKYI